MDNDGPCEFWDDDGCYCVCGPACSCEHVKVVDTGDELHRVLGEALRRASGQGSKQKVGDK